MIWILLCAALVTPVFSWNLTTTQSNVILQITDDVTLRCSDTGLTSIEAYANIEKITRIRLLKLSKTTSNSWKPYADLLLPNVSYVHLTKPGVDGIVTSGYLGKPNESFLSLTWKTASPDTVGTYKCEVDGFSTDEGQDVHVESATVVITNDVPTNEDLVDVLIQMRANLKRVIEDNHVAAQYWPTGNYSLLATADGCPDTPYSSMLHGYIQLGHDSSKAPKHSVSSPSLFSKTFFERCDNRNVLNFTFCSKKSAYRLDVQWPKGSYCIYPSSDKKCPDYSFKLGELVYFLEGTLKTRRHTNYPSYSITDTVQRIRTRYCCRDDGSPETPITLPTGRPFFLFKLKGKSCQAVLNMDVKNEWMFIDTNDAQTDYINYALNLDHQLNDLQLELCYYYKSPHRSRT